MTPSGHPNSALREQRCHEPKRERQVRHALAGQDQTKGEGLDAGRPAIPTGRLILGALATMKIILGTGHDPPVIPQLAPLQLRLLDVLGIDPRQLR
jgi:hypothetical protein